MKEKISRMELQRKAESIKGLVDDIINERINLPDNALIADFDATMNIFTKKRIELLDVINVYSPTSVQELAGIVKRTKQAVDRDLKLLERFEVVALEKRGKFTVPTVKRAMIVLPLKKPKQQRQEAITADVYINDTSVNKAIEVQL